MCACVITVEQSESESGGVRIRGESRCTEGKTEVRGLGGSKGKVTGELLLLGESKNSSGKAKMKKREKGDRNDSGRELKCGDGSGREREEKRVVK